MEKIFYGLKYYAFGRDDSNAVTLTGQYVLIAGHIVEIEKIEKDQFLGDRGNGISPELYKTEVNHPTLKVDEYDFLYDGPKKMGLIVWNQFGKKIKKIFMEAGVPASVSVPCYGGCREVKIL